MAAHDHHGRSRGARGMARTEAGRGRGVLSGGPRHASPRRAPRPPPPRPRPSNFTCEIGCWRVILDWTDGLGLDEAQKPSCWRTTAALTAVAQDEVRRRGSVHRVGGCPEESRRRRSDRVEVRHRGRGRGQLVLRTGAAVVFCWTWTRSNSSPSMRERSEGGVRSVWRWLGDLFDRLSLPVERLGQVDQNDVDADFAHAPPWNGDVGPTPE